MAKKDILKNLTSYDLVWSLLLLKPQSEEGRGRFDANMFRNAINESMPPAYYDINSVLSVLRMGRSVYQHSDQMHTEIYYLREGACKAAQENLEKRLGKFFLENFKPTAREIWKKYDSKIRV